MKLFSKIVEIGIFIIIILCVFLGPGLIILKISGVFDEEGFSEKGYLFFRR